jgi:hypothetical protein
MMTNARHDDPVIQVTTALTGPEGSRSRSVGLAEESRVMVERR